MQHTGPERVQMSMTPYSIDYKYGRHPVLYVTSYRTLLNTLMYRVYLKIDYTKTLNIVLNTAIPSSKYQIFSSQLGT